MMDILRVWMIIARLFCPDAVRASASRGGFRCPPRLLFFVALILLPGCSSSAAKPVLPQVAVTSQAEVKADQVQDQNRTTTPLPAPRVHATTLTPTVQPRKSAQYQFRLQLDYGQHTVKVEQSIIDYSPLEEPLNELILAVDAERIPGVFHLNGLHWRDGQVIEKYQLEDGTIHIHLDKPIQKDEIFGIQLEYDLHLPAASSFLGYTGRQLNLGDWYPFIPAYQKGKGWLVHPAGQVGEHLVYPTADYQVDLTLLAYSRPLVVAASALAQSNNDGNVLRYEIKDARGFALSISPDFKILSAREGLTELRGYVFPEHELAGQASIQAASQAVKFYADQFGPCPYPSLAVVEADFFDGMEYSGLFFLGSDYYGAYPGGPTSYLVPLSAHETAHQWWYGLVGNDPALEPWLDEALSAYSELLFYQKYYPKEVGWWWNYRVDRYNPVGKIDQTIYDLPQFRPYVNAVYLRGVKFIDALRQRMGDEAFHSFLKDYTETNSNRLATRIDFFTAVQRHTQLDISDLVKEYFSK